MKKLLRLVQDDVIRLYVSPGVEFGDLDDDSKNKIKSSNGDTIGPNVSLMGLLYGDIGYFDKDDEVDEDELIKKMLTSLERIKNEQAEEGREEQARINEEMKKEDEASNVSYKSKMHGNVYLMKNLNNGYTKIGFTKKEPKFREKTLQSEEPDILLISSFKGSMLDEETLHNQFNAKHTRGEWFDLNEEDFQEIEDYFSN